MKPDRNSRRLFGITRAKGKMYELGLDEGSHIAVPAGDEPEALFLLTVATLGDVAAELSEAVGEARPQLSFEDLSFSASFFDAFLASRFSLEVSHDVGMLAASAYYLAGRPGSSLVLARRLKDGDDQSELETLLRWILQARWDSPPQDLQSYAGGILERIARLVGDHFVEGWSVTELEAELAELRRVAYGGAPSKHILYADVVAAIIRLRLAVSMWKTLPEFSQIPLDQWAPVIRRPEFPKEMWPSQMLMGRAGIFTGTSAVIQMPTSAGKTRSVEMVLRSGFMSGRTTLAVVVAPFRALCHEIGTALRHAFRDDDIKVNELSDALQLDFLDQIGDLLGGLVPSSKYVLVLTPEKLLYVLRQAPTLLTQIGMVVYDEGHQFDSGSRGIIYELLLTEIKGLLPSDAQTLLISAVIRNAEAVGNWLVGDDVRVVNGRGLLPTARSVAFATWVERLGQLMFFESQSYSSYDYFVPRAIEQQQLNRFSTRENDRFFPEKGEDAWKDVSLYLGLRLAPQGTVAIFCGRKDTAAGLANRAVEIYKRGYSLEPPVSFSNSDEARRLQYLSSEHFGAESDQNRAAALGIYVHHGNTPHGLRLSIEHAMQHEKIRFVVCTSTLAQGVNLPIRYLIVSGIYQAGEKIKTRDFQNLIGRAGRAGMHTEGLVIFADPRVYDERRSERWRFDLSVDLLVPENAEETTSSLLDLLAPITNRRGRFPLALSAEDICHLILAEGDWERWAAEVERLNERYGFTARDILAILRRRRKLLSSVESYLMAKRGVGSFEEFRASVQGLAQETLAYALASEDQQRALTVLFGLVADYIEGQAPVAEKQAVYARTLLGVAHARRIEAWIIGNREALLALESNEEWLRSVWPLFAELSESFFFRDIDPPSLSFNIALNWLQGVMYGGLITLAVEAKGTKPWGKTRRRLTSEDVVDFCEKTLSFECALILGANSEFLFGESASTNDAAATLRTFQKAIKYGLPDALSISAYDRGFADRAVALSLSNSLQESGYANAHFGTALTTQRDVIVNALANYPTYFEAVLEGLS